MKRLALLTVLALVPASMVMAQGSLDEEINSELDRMYQSRNLAPSVQVTVQANPTQVQTNDQKTLAKADTATSSESTADTKVVQKNPTTVIEATPLGDSKADKLRKARQEAELLTEEKLVERIERSRLEDEQRRLDVLFGEKLEAMKAKTEAKAEAKAEAKDESVQTSVEKTDQKQVIINKNYGTQGDVSLTAGQTTEQKTESKAEQKSEATAKPEAKTEVAPVIVTVPVIVKAEEVKPEVKAEAKQENEVKVVVKEDKPIDREALKSELKAELSAVKSEAQVEETRGYVAALVGMGDYPDANNVRGNYSLGFAVGTKINDRILLEGSFQYSNFSIEQMDSGPWGWDPYYARITEMDQYSGSAVVKYQLLGGVIRPVVGGVASYTYRTFSDVQLAFGNNDASSHSIDLGVMAGADIEVSKGFSIGADARYMMNVFNRSSNEGLQRRFSQTVVGTGTPIEELNYLNFSIVGRATF